MRISFLGIPLTPLLILAKGLLMSELTMERMLTMLTTKKLIKNPKDENIFNFSVSQPILNTEVFDGNPDIDYLRKETMERMVDHGYEMFDYKEPMAQDIDFQRKFEKSFMIALMLTFNRDEIKRFIDSPISDVAMLKLRTDVRVNNNIFRFTIYPLIKMKNNTLHSLKSAKLMMNYLEK